METSQWQTRMDELLRSYDAFKQIEQFERLVTETDSIETWAEFQAWASVFGNNGCFRGQREASWDLVTTLDRKLWRTIEVKTTELESTSTHRVNALENEKTMLLDFQRGAHNHHKDTPPIDHKVDWLAMMQHYGAPTRFLDWTRSPYVALYFALNEASDGPSVLWAIDLKWLRERSDELLRKHHPNFPQNPDFDARYQYINGIVMSEPKQPIVVPVAPRRLNQRMTVQQGELLYNLNGI